MKKAFSIFFVLFVLLTLSACNTEKTEIEDCEWKVSAVMDNDITPTDSTYAIIAVGEPDEVYPEATIVNVTLTASDGKVTVTDITNGKVYNGTYKVTKNTPKGTDYEIEIDGQIGYATVAPTKYYNGDEIPTLPIRLGKYSLYFCPNK